MTYLLRVRYHRTGDEAAMTFVTALARAIEIIALTPHADILSTEERDDDREPEPGTIRPAEIELG